MKYGRKDWVEWRPLLDNLKGYHVVKMFERLDWATGASQEVVLEILRREGIDDFVSFFKSKTDEELAEYFRRYTTAPLVHEHYLTDMIYEKIHAAFPEAGEKVMALFFREVWFFLHRRSLLNASEVLNLLYLQPDLLDEAVSFVSNLETYKELRRLAVEALEIEGAASKEYCRHFKLEE
jgi:hypothetical protein